MSQKIFLLGQHTTQKKCAECGIRTSREECGPLALYLVVTSNDRDNETVYTYAEEFLCVGCVISIKWAKNVESQ